MINRYIKEKFEYYEYEYIGLKYTRNLFDNDDEDIFEGIEYLFNENKFEYDEMRECINDICEIIKQKEVRYEYIEEDYCIKNKQIIDKEKFLIDLC